MLRATRLKKSRLATVVDVTLFGTDDVSAATLSSLVSLRNTGAITLRTVCPDRPCLVARGSEAAGVPMERVPEGTPFLLPPSLHTLGVADSATGSSGTDAAAAVRRNERGLCAVVSFGHKLPAPLLSSFGLGAVNAHPSLLPRHAGAAPIEGAICEGDPVTGVTLQRVDPNTIDAGAALADLGCAVGPAVTAASLRRWSAAACAGLVTDHVRAKVGDDISCTPRTPSSKTSTFLPPLPPSRAPKPRRHMSWLNPAGDSLVRVNGLRRALDGGLGSWLELASYPVVDSNNDCARNGKVKTVCAVVAEASALHDDGEHDAAYNAHWANFYTRGGGSMEDPMDLKPDDLSDLPMEAWDLNINAVSTSRPGLATEEDRDQLRQRLGADVEPGVCTYDKRTKQLAVRCVDGWLLVQRVLVPGRPRAWAASEFANAHGMVGKKRRDLLALAPPGHNPQ